MTYQKRMATAIAVSLVIHAVALGVSGFGVRFRGLGPGEVPGPPLVVNLQPSQDEPSRQAIESSVPAQRPPENTSLISDRDSNAQDPQDEVQGKELAPLDTQDSDFFAMGGTPAVPPQPAAKAPAPEPKKPEEKPAKETKKTPPKEAAEKKAPENTTPKPPAPTEKLPDTVAMAKADVTQANPAAAAQAAEAAAQGGSPAAPQTPAVPPSPLAGLKPGKFRGSIEGGIKGKGVLGFEAMKDELAPYLLEVQRRVERNWNLAMGLKYTGTTPTKAVVDCVIGEDGKVISVTIAKEGNTPTYAPICKESIEKSAPFPPFPFKVPDIYRDKTLEIRWTFNFM